MNFLVSIYFTGKEVKNSISAKYGVDYVPHISFQLPQLSATLGPDASDVMSPKEREFQHWGGTSIPYRITFLS